MGDLGEIKSSTKPPDCTKGDLGVDTVVKSRRGCKNVTPAPENFLSSSIQKTNDFWVNRHKKVSNVKVVKSRSGCKKVTPATENFLSSSIQKTNGFWVNRHKKVSKVKGPNAFGARVKIPTSIKTVFLARQLDIGISPLTSMEKSDSTERRVFPNMSWPKNESVNDLINKNVFLGEKFDLTYTKVDDLVRQSRFKGRYGALFKRDLEVAYCHLLRAEPKDISLLCLLIVLVVCKVFAHLLKGAKVIIYGHNIGAVAAIHQNREKESFLQVCARDIRSVGARSQCQVSGTH